MVSKVKNAVSSGTRSAIFPPVPVLSCPPQHPVSHHGFLSVQEPAAPGGNPWSAESTLKSGRLGGEHQRTGPTISRWTNTPALSLIVHEGKRNTRGHFDLYFGCTALDIGGVQR